MSGKEKTNGSLAMAPKVITIPATSQESPRRLSMMTFFTCPIRPPQNIHGCPSGTVLLFLVLLPL